MFDEFNRELPRRFADGVHRMDWPFGVAWDQHPGCCGSPENHRNKVQQWATIHVYETYPNLPVNWRQKDDRSLKIQQKLLGIKKVKQKRNYKPRAPKEIVPAELASLPIVFEPKPAKVKIKKIYPKHKLSNVSDRLRNIGLIKVPDRYSTYGKTVAAWNYLQQAYSIKDACLFAGIGLPDFKRFLEILLSKFNIENVEFVF